MRKVMYLPVLLVLLAGLTACGGSATESAPVEYAYELVIEVPEVLPPTPEPPLEEPATVEQPPEEVTPEEPLPAHLQYIVDAGRFSGERYRPCLWSTYTNTALGIAYHFVDPDAYSSHFGVQAGVIPEGGLMEVWVFGEQFFLNVISGSGEQWVRQQADEFVESYIEAWLRNDESLREYLGDKRNEEIARLIEMRPQEEQSRAEWWAENRPGMPPEVVISPLTPEELDMVEFWPVEYEIAGREFAGFQINVILPAAGFNDGNTFLFHQIDNDTALVISIASGDSADYIARRHIARFTALP